MGSRDRQARLRDAEALDVLRRHIEDVRRRIEQYDRVLAWDLGPAVRALEDVADGLNYDEDGNRLVAGSPANLKAIAEADALLVAVTRAQA